MKIYYYGLGFTDEFECYLIRKYHEDDWYFTGKIRYLFKERNKEPDIEFETQIIDNSWFAKLFRPLLASDTKWIDGDILFDETEPYEVFIPKTVVVDCDK